MKHDRLARWFCLYRDRGDAAALAKVFDRTAPELLRVAQSFVKDLALAEDLLQETYLTAIDRAQSFDAARPLVPWLVGILTNLARNARRERTTGHLGVEVVATSADPLDQLTGVELTGELERGLESLPRGYREVLQPLLVDGKRAAEIATELGRSPATVRSQIHRGLSRLRAALPPGLGAAFLAALAEPRGLAAIKHAVFERAEVLGATATAGASVAPGLAVRTWMPFLVGTAAVATALSLPFVLPDPTTATTALVPPATRGSDVPRPDRAGDAVPSDGARAALAAVAAEDPAPAPASLVGRLVEPDGRPIAGVDVVLAEMRAQTIDFELARSLWGEREFGVLADRTETDAEGAFTLRHADAQGQHAIVFNPGAERAQARLVDVPLVAGETTDLGALELAEPARWSGRVVDATGQPVAGARVRVAALPSFFGQWGMHELRADSQLAILLGERRTLEMSATMRNFMRLQPLAATTTGRDGSFELWASANPRAALMVDRDGIPALWREQPAVEIGSFALGTIELAPTRELAGRVLDADGEPLAGADLYVGTAGWLSPWTALQAAGSTDSDGGFRWTVARGERVVCAVRAPHTAGWHLVGPVAAERLAEIRMPRAVRVDVTVSRDGEPFDGEARFAFARAAAEAPWTPREWTRIAYDVPEPERTDAGWSFARVLPGRYAVSARAGGLRGEVEFEVATRDVQATVALAPDPASVELPARPLGTLRGSVHGDHGASELVVLVWNQDPGNWIQQIPRARVVDDAGAFDFGRVPAGLWGYEVHERATIADLFEAARLHFEGTSSNEARARGLCFVRTGEVTGLDIELLGSAPRAATLAGVVRLDGAPLPRAAAQLDHPALAVAELADTDELGRFRFEELPAGAVRLALAPQADSPAASFYALLTLELAAGEMRELDLDWTTRARSVVVRDRAGGEPVSGIVVHGDQAGPYGTFRSWATTGTDGIATLELFGRGPVTVHTSDRGFGAAVATYADGSDAIDFRVEPSVVCAGRIAFTGDRPEGGMHWVLTAFWPAEFGGGGVDRSPVEPEHLTFDFGALVPGEYDVQLWAESTRGAQWDPLLIGVGRLAVPAEGSQTIDLELRAP